MASDLTVSYLPCVRCGFLCVGEWHYIGALGPLCPSCFGNEVTHNRKAYLARPAYGAETDCEPRIRELEAEVERLREALRGLLDTQVSDEGTARSLEENARAALGEV